MSTTNGWDAVYAMSLPQVNALLFQQYGHPVADGHKTSLSYMMADVRALCDYCDVLIDLTKAAGACWFEVPRIELGMQIAREEEGFGVLSDDDLAIFAISPLALCLIDKYLARPDTVVGKWLLREQAAYEEARRAGGAHGLLT